MPPTSSALTSASKCDSQGFFSAGYVGDPDGDVVQIGTQFLDATGSPLPYLSRDDGTVLTEGYIRLSGVQSGDQYSTVLTVDLTSAVSNAILEIDQAVAMNVFAVDIAAQESERVRLEFTDAPLVADDEECDP